MKKILIALSLAMLFSSTAVNARGHGHKATKVSKAVPTFSAKSFLIADSEGMILREQEGGIVRPIASISKLMVGLLAAEQDLSEQLEVPSTRSVQSSIPRKVTSLTRKELLTLALVHSDNFAAQILCTNLPNCVEAMNQRAMDLGMVNTHYNEPTGLDKGNVSTAQDLLKLMLVASSNTTVSELSSMSKAEVDADGKLIKVRNTNPLTAKYTILLSKTGFTNPAGGCILFIIGNHLERRIIILLGSRNTRTRIIESLELYKNSL